MRAPKFFKSAAAADVEGAQARLTAARTELVASRAKLQCLEEQRVAAEDYETAQDLEKQADLQRWEIDRMAKAIPGLETELAAAAAVRRQKLIHHHRSTIAAIYPRLRAALDAAADIQTEARKARDAAIADLGDHFVQGNIPAIAYAGFLFPDLIHIWASEMDKVFDPEAYARAAQKVKAAVATPLPAPRPQPESDIGRRRVVVLGEDPGRAPKRARNYDDTTPLEPGEVRVRVLRAGYTPSDNAPQCDRGQVIRLRRLACERAVAAGAVEIVEEGVSA